MNMEAQKFKPALELSDLRKSFGKAEIITEELRLLERIFYDFRKMFD